MPLCCAPQTAAEPLRRSAFALVPNVVWFKSFGKVLFTLCDLLVALLIVSTQRARHPPGEHSAVKAREPARRPRSHARRHCRAPQSLAFWLFNPLVITVSTRGNMDVMVVALVLGAHLRGCSHVRERAPAWAEHRRGWAGPGFLLCLLRGKLMAAAVLYGLAVHVKIYPIIYLPAILLFLGGAPRRASCRQVPTCAGRPGCLVCVCSRLTARAHSCCCLCCLRNLLCLWRSAASRSC
jgi:phosphatidylinositol glycan class M